MSSTIFSLQNLTLAGDSSPRLNAVSLQISDGATAVMGLSGAGKTSLLNVLAGFETTFSGTFSSELQKRTVPQKARLPLFWVPQSGGLWPHLTAEQHLKIVAEDSGADSKPESDSGRFSERVDEILDQFDLTPRRLAFPAELSQGERSRLALARALLTRAQVLLLDEPLSHVDPVRKPAYWNIVRQFVVQENISMIFTSHEPETVLRQAKHIVCLDNGQVAYQGSVSELYDNPPTAQLGAFLGPLNCFQTDEAVLFFSDQPQGTVNCALRPEKVRIAVEPYSDLELVAQAHCGVYSESIVRHVATDKQLSVLHQVPYRLLPKGQRVVFRVADIQERPGE